MLYIEQVERSLKRDHNVMDWLGMESAIRLVYNALASHEINEFQALNYISEIVGKFTGRGYPEIDAH